MVLSVDVLNLSKLSKQDDRLVYRPGLPREEFKQHAEKKFRQAEDKIWATTEKATVLYIPFS